MNLGNEISSHASNPPGERDALYANAPVCSQLSELTETCTWYESFIEKYPDHFDALYRLGLIEQARGNDEAAVRALRRAVAVDPSSSAVLADLAAILIRLQRHDEAAACFKHIVTLNAHSADDQYRRGSALCSLGLFDQAAESFEAVIRINPTHSGALIYKGFALHEGGRFNDAITAYNRALALVPDDLQGLINRGATFKKMGDLENAICDFDRALKLAPGHAGVWHNRAESLYVMERFDEAKDSYESAISINPRLTQAWLGLINVLMRTERVAQGLDACERALKSAPAHAGIWHHRGDALFFMNRFEEAKDCYDRVISIDPKCMEPWLGLTNVFMRTKRVAQALDACERALELAPNAPNALLIMGQCHALRGDAETAIQFFDRALEITPNDEIALFNKIFSLDFCGEADFAAHQQARAEWWRRIGQGIYANSPRQHKNSRDPNRRIVLGYVSAEFRLHSAASNFLPVIEGHDKTKFEVICYSGAPAKDDVTTLFANIADRWRDILHWSDDELRQRIAIDEVDILIDLAGPSERNRLRIFASKPAPIQVTAWGHATGTGQPTIDYFFADPVLIPNDVRHLFAETIYDLPCVIIIQPPPDELRVPEPPVISNGYLTYGVFNRVSKISDAAIAVWAQILKSDPAARLLIKDHAITDRYLRDMLVDRFALQGITKDRLDLIGGTLRADHMKVYGQVDICLDPFPHCGGVSTWEALYMGVPVVTKIGNSITKRLGAAILSAIGLTEWIASDDRQYIDIALKASPDRLRALRLMLPDMINMRCGPIAYTRAVEQAYQTMWRKYCGESEGAPR